ncbi:MAG TPA: amidohydrolase family protein [Gemmatimonadales bacterium]|nr:amidohydrolase family protein [Gemmatimonadales bacterium]
MTIVDFHNHFYPPEYLEALRTGGTTVTLSTDGDGNPVLGYPGDYNVAVPGHRDIAYREDVLAREGIDRQVLTFTTPGTHVETPQRAVQLARLVNDALARVAHERAGRFTALATLPLNDPAGSVIELERVMTQLGFKGAMLFSNVNGVALADARYEPLWQRADALGAVLYIHPTNPVGVEAMTDFWLMPLVGFPWDTTLAAAKLVFSGVVERFPKIRWVLGHLGGAIPYIAERLDRGYEAFPECREHIRKAPSAYLKEFYYDTVNFDPAALRLAVEFAGPRRVLAGSDYPHRIGSLRAMLDSLRRLDISDEERAMILGGNATRLLDL